MVLCSEAGAEERRLGLAISLDHHGAEHLDAQAKFVQRHWGGCVDEMPQSAVVVTAQVGMGQEPVDHRGREKQQGDAVALDGRENRPRVGVGKDHIHAAPCTGRQADRSGGMGQWRHHEMHRRVRQGHRGEKIGEQRLVHAVRHHHALGKAGGPACASDRHHVVRPLIDVHRRGRLLSDPRFKARDARRKAVDHDKPLERR